MSWRGELQWTRRKEELEEKDSGKSEGVTEVRKIVFKGDCA